jgi:hypothetical protein
VRVVPSVSQYSARASKGRPVAGEWLRYHDTVVWLRPVSHYVANGLFGLAGLVGGPAPGEGEDWHRKERDDLWSLVLVDGGRS